MRPSLEVAASCTCSGPAILKIRELRSSDRWHDCPILLHRACASELLML